MSIKEATDTVMATLGAYDALWDGILAPEIVDAEYYDWDDDLRHPFILTRIVKMPVPLNHSYPPLVEGFARNEALDVLKAVVEEKGNRYIYCHHSGELRGRLMSQELDWDGKYDCPLDVAWDERAIITLEPPSIGLKHLERDEAMDALIATVAELGLAFGGPLWELSIEGVLTDCPSGCPSDDLVLFGIVKSCSQT